MIGLQTLGLIYPFVCWPPILVPSLCGLDSPNGVGIVWILIRLPL